MAVVEAPPSNMSATTLNGLATVIFASKPYRRVIRTIAFFNTAGGRVTIYRGTIAAFTKVSSHTVGDDQTYNIPFNLPSGQGVFVQWDNAPVPVSSARAVMTWMEER